MKIFRDDDPKSILPNVLEGRKVIVEIGCGAGRYCRHLAEYSSMLYCIDIDPVALKKTEKSLSSQKRTEFRVLTSTAKIKTHAIDVVLFANSFHDIYDKIQIEAEVSRVLKTSGRIVIVDWKKDSKTLFGPPQKIRLSEKEYMGYFKEFKVVKRFSTGDYHFGLVLARTHEE